MKNAVVFEIKKNEASEFYIPHHGEFADLQDFGADGLKSHFSAAFPDISPRAIAEFIGDVIHIYYLR